MDMVVLTLVVALVVIAASLAYLIAVANPRRIDSRR